MQWCKLKVEKACFSKPSVRFFCILPQFLLLWLRLFFTRLFFFCVFENRLMLQLASCLLTCLLWRVTSRPLWSVQRLTAAEQRPRSAVFKTWLETSRAALPLVAATLWGSSFSRCDWDCTSFVFHFGRMNKCKSVPETAGQPLCRYYLFFAFECLQPLVVTQLPLV